MGNINGSSGTDKMDGLYVIWDSGNGITDRKNKRHF